MKNERSGADSRRRAFAPELEVARANVYVKILQHLVAADDPVIAEHARWALDRLNELIDTLARTR